MAERSTTRPIENFLSRALFVAAGIYYPFYVGIHYLALSHESEGSSWLLSNLRQLDPYAALLAPLAAFAVVIVTISYLAQIFGNRALGVLIRQYTPLASVAAATGVIFYSMIAASLQSSITASWVDFTIMGISVAGLSLSFAAILGFTATLFARSRYDNQFIENTLPANTNSYSTSS